MNQDPSVSSHSITQLIHQLRDEDQQAAAQIWQRYFQRLLPLARAKLKALPHRAVDEEDVLVSVFDRFFRAAHEDRFARLEDRNDLWQLLLMLTERKVADHYRRSKAQKRHAGEVFNEAEFAEMDLAKVGELADRDPSPEFLAAFNDHLERAVQKLNDQKTREVALLRMEGFSNREIAKQVGISLSSVERKLRLVRKLWNNEFSAE